MKGSDLIMEKDMIVLIDTPAPIVRPEIACTYICLKGHHCCFANFKDLKKECAIDISNMRHAETISQIRWTFLRRCRKLIKFKK